MKIAPVHKSIQKVEYRELTPEDLEQYKKLIQSHTKLGGRFRSTAWFDFMSKRIDNISDSVKIYGAFYGDHLVVACEVILPSDFSYWYLSWHISDPSNSVFSHKQKLVIFGKLMNHVTIYPESVGLYGFYTIRPLKHEHKFFNVRQKFISSKETHSRYDYYLEKIYYPGDKVEITHHKIWVSGFDRDFIQPMAIVVYMLKHEYRDEILSNQFKSRVTKLK